MFPRRLFMQHLALILVVAIHATHALYCDREVGSAYDSRTSIYVPDNEVDGRTCQQLFKEIDDPNLPANVARDKEEALRKKVEVQLQKCLSECHLDICLKQESIKKDYRGCRTSCPAWNHCMKSQECTLYEASEGDCKRQDCNATDLCGNDCVTDNADDLAGLADQKCSCVNGCREPLGLSSANCRYSKMYKDCTTFLKTGKAE